MLQPGNNLASPYVLLEDSDLRAQEPPFPVLFLVNPIRRPNKRNGTNHEDSHFFFSEDWRAYFSFPYL
jgi:hypothetical protein